MKYAFALESIPTSLADHDQLGRASTSVPWDTAEGNGKSTPKDRCKFFDTARGPALECAACLNVLLAQKKINSEAARIGKAFLIEVVSMLVGSIRPNSLGRNV